MTRRFDLGAPDATPPDVREALPPRVSPEAAAFAASEERMLRLCARRGEAPGMLHPGFADATGDATIALALLSGMFAAGFAAGAFVQGALGWPGVAVAAGAALGLAATGAAWATRPRPGR